MASSQSIIADFIKCFALLAQTQSNVLVSYDIVKFELGIRKKNNLPLSGSPLIKLQNQLIILEYLINQHILNCNVYKEIINSGIEIDEQFEKQISSMIMISYQFAAENKALSKTVQPFSKRVSKDRHVSL